ncbi:MAG: hypothetical protein PHN37_02585, partial [Candidatus Pacebacteria bacterium]|nr:hypothetical protein [Candidatus Paceibacterota bacterium]
MNEKYAKYLLEKTQNDYNLNSDNFAMTRKYLPEDLNELAKIVKKGDFVLDAGCGTGYLFSVLE